MHSDGPSIVAISVTGSPVRRHANKAAPYRCSSTVPPPPAAYGAASIRAPPAAVMEEGYGAAASGAVPPVPRAATTPRPVLLAPKVCEAPPSRARSARAPFRPVEYRYPRRRAGGPQDGTGCPRIRYQGCTEADAPPVGDGVLYNSHDR